MFIVDNALVFPDNIIYVEDKDEDEAFYDIPKCIDCVYVYGKNVQSIG